MRQPQFGHVEHVTVHFDDLDAMGILHNARYAVLLERALTPYWTERGIAFSAAGTAPPTCSTPYASSPSPTTPRSPGSARWRCTSGWSIGTSSARYASNSAHRTAARGYADGTRSIVRLDPATLRPTAWTEAARAVATTLLRPAALPA